VPAGLAVSKLDPVAAWLPRGLDVATAKIGDIVKDQERAIVQGRALDVLEGLLNIGG
jgi:hypothetical protein